MNIRVGTWFEGSQIFKNIDSFKEAWVTNDWLDSCHCVDFFIAFEKKDSRLLRKYEESHSDFFSNIKYDVIDRDILVDDFASNIVNHWRKKWFSLHKEFLKFVGLELKKESVVLDECRRWLAHWLNFWSSYQAMERYWLTYAGDDERDVAVLCAPWVENFMKSKKIGKLYKLVNSFPSQSREGTAGYYWPPLNGAKQVFFKKDSNQRLVVLIAQDNTMRQLLNPKNLRLYFCEHLQLVNGAVVTDFDLFSCIGRLLGIEWIDLDSYSL